VTGPTGSGKTTTLYSALMEINAATTTKIITTEDPVEYQLEGINQIQVHPKIGLTFAIRCEHPASRPGRGAGRRNPRLETAENAIQASLTGHLVFSTLHTNDAAGAYTRLTDMGVEPFLVASTVEAVMAQRLPARPRWMKC
jgi:type II secretory ATPase GspE/PulE/Tfp pilus assembly ATPase PilB-like protein